MDLQSYLPLLLVGGGSSIGLFLLLQYFMDSQSKSNGSDVTPNNTYVEAAQGYAEITASNTTPEVQMAAIEAQREKDAAENEIRLQEAKNEEQRIQNEAEQHDWEEDKVIVAGGTVMGAVAGAAVAGATIGSVVPVAGTLIGAGAGAVVGFLGATMVAKGDNDDWWPFW